MPCCIKAICQFIPLLWTFLEADNEDTSQTACIHSLSDYTRMSLFLFIALIWFNAELKFAFVCSHSHQTKLTERSPGFVLNGVRVHLKHLNLSKSKFSRRQIDGIFLIFIVSENMLWHVMQIVSLGGNLHEMSKSIFRNKIDKYFKMSSTKLFTQHACRVTRK